MNTAEAGQEPGRGRRGANIAATRRRIIEAARDLFGEEGFHGVGLESVAKKAGMTRATVYYQFGSKLGLLDALVADIEARGESWRIVEAASHPDPVTALRGALHESCRFWAADHGLARKLLALAAVDPDAARVLGGREERRKELVDSVVARLAADGRLRPGCSRRHASEVLTLLSSFEAFDQLHRARGLSPARAARTVLQLASCVVDGAD